MSLWAEYRNERFGHETLEEPGGFISYSLNPPNAMIEEFYVQSKFRGSPLAKRLADRVFDIARANGCTHMWAKVQPGAFGAEHAMKTNLHYGFKLVCNQGNDTIMMKEIGG